MSHIPLAKAGDRIVGIDTHIIMVSSPSGPVPTPMPMPFSGAVTGDVSEDVSVQNQPAALDGSTADNAPPHIPAGGPFQTPPANKASIQATSTTVFINNKAVARVTDSAMTCNDPADAPNGVVVGVSTVLIGA